MSRFTEHGSSLDERLLFVTRTCTFATLDEHDNQATAHQERRRSRRPTNRGAIAYYGGWHAE